MPPISPQGSRTGLITALVIFVILFCTATFLYIYENAQRRNLELRVQQLESRQADLVSEVVMTGPDVTQLIEVAKQSNPPMTAVEAVLAQRRQLAKTIAGQDLPPDKVNDAVKRAVTQATTKEVAEAVKIVPSAGLTDIVTGLANGVTKLQQEKANLAGQVQAAAADKEQSIKDRDALVKQKDDEIAALNTKIEEERTQLASDRASNQGAVKNIEKNTQAALTQQQESNAQLASQLSQATASIQKKDVQIDELTRRLKNIRPQVNEPTVQKADGEVTRVPDPNTVFINRGLGDQIVKGMTFEVYDQQKGIPALGNAEHALGNADMPVGKASIEVIDMGPGYSVCRVIRRTPGYGINIGDLIENLVYDATQKYNFVVYGNFDLNNDGRADSADADVIKQLITRWGGRVTNEVNVNTDFIIMGVEPKAEAALPDDDPLVRQQKLEAQQALDRYLNVVRQGTQLNIPIMNQNRFLNFIGYASQATR